jgi:hypothetical protein
MCILLFNNMSIINELVKYMQRKIDTLVSQLRNALCMMLLLVIFILVLRAPLFVSSHVQCTHTHTHTNLKCPVNRYKQYSMFKASLRELVFGHYKSEKSYYQISL